MPKTIEDSTRIEPYFNSLSNQFFKVKESKIFLVSTKVSKPSE